MKKMKIETDQNKENNKGKNQRKQKSRGMFIVYLILALILIVMQVLVWVFGRNLVVLLFHGEEVSIPFVTKLRAAIVSVIGLIVILRVAIRLVPVIPDIISRMKYDDRKRQERYNAFLGTCFSGDDKIRDQMLFVLQDIDHKRYSDADETCVRLLEKCETREERAVILYCRMICCGEMGNIKEAVELGERALALRKGYVPALLETAGFCMKLNKMEDAEKYLLEIRESGQMELRVSRMLYQVYMARNRYPGALAEALCCERLEPHSLEISACVCRAAHKCGEKDLVNSRMQKCADEHYEGYADLRKEIRGY